MVNTSTQNLTSHDRTVVAVPSSRIINSANPLVNFEHNTPLVLLLENECAKLLLEIYSGGHIYEYAIEVSPDGKKFRIPDEINVASKKFKPTAFDAEFPYKKTMRYRTSR